MAMKTDLNTRDHSNGPKPVVVCLYACLLGATLGAFAAVAWAVF